METQTVAIKDIKIHRYAELTPRMIPEQFEALKIDIKENGQLEPIKLSGTNCYDGRHRIAALSELGATTVEALVDNSLSDSDIKSQVLSLENRRHQTPTQLAVMAFKEYLMLSADTDTKESQGSIAKRFGISRKNLVEVKSLYDRAPDLIDFLFNGNKFNIGTPGNPSYTNNVRAINAYIKSERIDRMSEPTEFKLTVEESEYVESIANDLILKHGKDTMLDIAKRIYAICNKENSNESKAR